MTTIPLSSTNMLNEPGYNPENLLDILIEGLKVKNDAGLARKLHIDYPIISKIRNRRRPITAEVLIRMHDVSELPISSLRHMMGLAPKPVLNEPKEVKHALVG
jgi:hypothetical protein